MQNLQQNNENIEWKRCFVCQKKKKKKKKEKKDFKKKKKKKKKKKEFEKGTKSQL